jgi:hypothetical protein
VSKTQLGISPSARSVIVEEYMTSKSFVLCRKRFAFQFLNDISVSDKLTIYRLDKKILENEPIGIKKHNQKWAVPIEKILDRLSLEISHQKPLIIYC